MTKYESNLSVNNYNDPDADFREVEDVGYMDPNSVWDRGKITNTSSNTPDDMMCLRRLETSVTNLESFLESLPNQETSNSCRNTRSMILLMSPSPPLDDTLSDVDLEKFDANINLLSNNQSEQINRAIDEKDETTSLSDYHNVRDVLLNIRERLESYLKVNQELATENGNTNGNLEGNISQLRSELERYVHIINEKKENELRKFSENMSNQSNIKQMKKAFSRKEKLQTNIYETLESSHLKYAIADNDSLPNSLRLVNDRILTQGGFTMRNCYDNNYIFETYSDFSSVEYYTMLINEDKSEKLLNDAPPQSRYHEREKISLIFRDPENVIKQWQNYQLKTIELKPKKEKSLKLKWNKGPNFKPHDIWGFTLDYHQNRVLQLKLAKERRLR